MPSTGPSSVRCSKRTPAGAAMADIRVPFIDSYLGALQWLARIRRGNAAVDVQHVAGALSGAPVGREVQDRRGDVLGQDVDPEGRPLAVVLLELVGLYPIVGGALLAPRGVPDARALEHRVRVDGVDADAVRPALLCQAAGQMELGGLRRRVRRGALAGDERVLGGHEDDRTAAALRAQDAERLARDEEVAGAEDRVVALPLGERGLLDRRA